MRIGFSGVVMPTASLEQDITLAAQAAYEGVEGWISKLWPHLEKHGLAALRRILSRHRLPVWSLAPGPDVTFRDRAGIEEISANVHRLSEVARHLGAPWLVLLPGDGVVPLRAVTSTLRRLGADPPALIHVPFASLPEEAEGWARGMREQTLAAISDPAVSPR